MKSSIRFGKRDFDKLGGTHRFGREGWLKTDPGKVISVTENRPYPKEGLF